MVGPLDGYRVLDLSQVVSGPLAAMLLADQGAEVTKVEPTTGLGDVTRLPGFAKGGMPAFYLNNNRGKRSVAIDISSEKGREIVLELAARSDVVLQNFRPGAVDRLGIGYEDIRSINPDVVYCSISGFGPDGPYSERPVLDPVIQGLTGVISRQINPEIPFPDLVRNLYADKSTALTAAQAITAALLVRERGGGGQHVEIPMLDACLYFFWPDGMMDKTVLDPDTTQGFLLSTVYNLTDCADGKIVYFVVNDTQRHSLYEAVGHPEWKEDPRFCDMTAITNAENFQALGVLLAEAFSELPMAEVLDRLIAGDVPCGPILDADEVLEDPQVRHNDSVVIWNHPVAGRIQQPRPAARFSTTPANVAASASLRGADNDQVLAELGRGEDEIAALRASGVIT
ncbi:MAG: CoA transferase [Actinomycetota bacterium]|nr:CoA transferase [Actinomycetota bacterium]